MKADLINLQSRLEGELFFDESAVHRAQKLVYATDASVYQETPLAVAIPKNEEDIAQLIAFADAHKITLIPRAAGTSLAGQVVGNGIVVDTSKHFDKILEINVEERWVRVQPGIIRDDLNKLLKPYGLMFGPETSTSSRAMIGGMIGNNSSGLHSISWGDTRSHLFEAKVFLSNGEQTVIKPLTAQELKEKAQQKTLEGRIYQRISQLLEDPKNKALIWQNYPKSSLTRRNTGYALDMLLHTIEGGGIDMCKLLAGSEGTLAMVTEAKLNLLPLPGKVDNLVCVHFRSLSEALKANLVILQHRPLASELVDKYIMDFTKGHLTYDNYRFFIAGDPEAILMAEFRGDTVEEVSQKSHALIASLEAAGLGYAYPVLTGEQAQMAWEVRKAGLGLIRNLPGPEQPVNLIEDCAVPPEDLPHYIEELEQLLKRKGLKASYYAHAGAGELHVEPMINLKTSDGLQKFREVLEETAALVKKYRGSLSGEHGDGRLRGEFIPAVLGADVYQLLKEVKYIFDPHIIFNAGKIVDTPPMDTSLRYEHDKQEPVIKTYFDFSNEGGMLRLAEKCSGSGDCRKSHMTGGTMCPSYMATRVEKDTTRARANILRQFLTGDASQPFKHEEIKEVLDLCLSCKACKSECPSSVDMAKMKAEFLQHYYDAKGIPFRTKLVSNFTRLQRAASIFPGMYNGLANNRISGKLIRKMSGFAPKRSLPEVAKQTLRKWKRQWDKAQQGKSYQYRVYLFADEFTNYNDVEIGKSAIKLLNGLGYEVIIPHHAESGRTMLSKGMVRDAQKIAKQNVSLLADQITEATPLVGIEPSAILTFREEYPDLVGADLKERAKNLGKHAYLLEEFLMREVNKGRISKDQFHSDTRTLHLHGHCYQKALHVLHYTEQVLQLPSGYQVQQIPSGCCGMAGSFGYEKEHYDVSMQIGELVLFPAVRQAGQDALIVAAGTSCRHQIKDGTERRALHPAEVLWLALKK